MKKKAMILIATSILTLNSFSVFAALWQIIPIVYLLK